MSEEKNVLVSFEVPDVVEDNELDKVFVSGPVNIIAKVDTIDELNDPELLAAAQENPNAVVFVSSVTNNDQSKPGYLLHRGTYYRYTKEIIGGTETWSWKEVAVGNHIHDNKAALDSIHIDKDGFLYAKDGVFQINGDIQGQLVPEIPEEIKEIIENNKKIYDNGLYPTNSDWNHLDAALEELTGSVPHEDGNIAMGTCESLYNALAKTHSNIEVKTF